MSVVHHSLARLFCFFRKMLRFQSERVYVNNIIAVLRVERIFYAVKLHCSLLVHNRSAKAGYFDKVHTF